MAWTVNYPIVWLPQAQGGDSTSAAVNKHILEFTRIYSLLSNDVAPLAHAHSTSDITNLSNHTHTSVQVAGTIPIGGIVLWSGSVATVPTGWNLCDGTNGTVDLRDRFVVGAGSTYSVGGTGGATTHTHTTGNVTLTIAQIPSHTHQYSDIFHTERSAHTPFPNPYVFPAPVIGSSDTDFDNDRGSQISRTTDSSGTGGPHNHGATSSDSSLPPYYALAYIQRIT